MERPALLGSHSSRNRTISASNLNEDKRLRTVFKAGRPPWYNTQGKQEEALVIGVCGGSASGKTTVAHRIIEELGVSWVCLLSMDSFYKVLTPEQKATAARSEYDFDCPDAFDIDLLVRTLTDLKAGRSVEVPHYNFKTHGREPGITMYGANVVIFEGILAFCDERIRDLLDVKIFVVEDADVRLARRLLRDTHERGRQVEGSIKQYNTFVYPAFKNHIEPTMQFADLVVPRGVSNAVAMDLIISRVKEGLASRGHDLRHTSLENLPDPATLHVLPCTEQTVGMFTTMRDATTSRDEFVFFSRRIMRLVIEHALTLCRFADRKVVTCDGTTFDGRERVDKLVGVSIIRAGMSMEESLRQCVKDVTIGQLLIQTNPESGQPEFFYKALPSNIQDHRVLLMDATLATGAAAMMAIRVLCDHGVPPENIIFCTLIASKLGVANVAYAFPNVAIVAGALDEAVDQQFHIRPGLGNFGDRYYGTEAATTEREASLS